MLCCAEVETDLDVEAELLRLDAIADGLVTRGFRPGSAREDAEALSGYLSGELGFAGDDATYHDPSNALLTHVLDRRQGLPITVSIVYIAVARRVGIRAYGVNTPGHFLVGIADGMGIPVVVDAFDRGRIMSVEDVRERIRTSTAGLGTFDPSMLTPTPAAVVIRRLLNNLTRDFLAEGDTEDALWTIELKRLLPGSGRDDLVEHGEVLIHLGRYRRAADVLDEYLADHPEGESVDDIAALAIRARAKMN